MAHQTVWTTKRVEETIDKYRSGLDVDLSFFHERNIALKGRNISFILTPEEEAEFTKCSDDIEYFVKKYCKFMTDKGLSTVKLHPYQGEILNICGEEEWLEDIEEFAPKNRNFILMASRQTGKCFSPLTEIYIKNKNNSKIYKTSAYNLYKIYKLRGSKRTSLLSKIKNILYKILNYIDNGGE